jgi:hypothetical protein
VPELIGGAGGLGWVAVKAVLLFAVAVVGLRLGERRTLAQLSAFDFAVAVAIGALLREKPTVSQTAPLAASSYPYAVQTQGRNAVTRVYLPNSPRQHAMTSLRACGPELDDMNAVITTGRPSWRA